MEASGNTIEDTTPTLAERCWEWLVAGISWLHLFLAKYLTIAFTWLWRVQGRMRLQRRFAIGMLLLAIGSAGMAVLLPVRHSLTSGLLRRSPTSGHRSTSGGTSGR